MKQEEEKCCGGCCWFFEEDIEGCGNCVYERLVAFMLGCKCSDPACDSYVSIEQMRHYQAVLLQANRYRRDRHVPAIYRMPNQKELGLAIDFALEYMRIFSKL